MNYGYSHIRFVPDTMFDVLLFTPIDGLIEYPFCDHNAQNVNVYILRPNLV